MHIFASETERWRVSWTSEWEPACGFYRILTRERDVCKKEILILPEYGLLGVLKTLHAAVFVVMSAIVACLAINVEVFDIESLAIMLPGAVILAGLSLIATLFAIKQWVPSRYRFCSTDASITCNWIPGVRMRIQYNEVDKIDVDKIIRKGHTYYRVRLVPKRPCDNLFLSSCFILLFPWNIMYEEVSSIPSGPQKNERDPENAHLATLELAEALTRLVGAKE